MPTLENAETEKFNFFLPDLGLGLFHFVIPPQEKEGTDNVAGLFTPAAKTGRGSEGSDGLVLPCGLQPACRGLRPEALSNVIQWLRSPCLVGFYAPNFGY